MNPTRADEPSRSSSPAPASFDPVTLTAGCDKTGDTTGDKTCAEPVTETPALERRGSRRRGDTLTEAIYAAVLEQMSVHGFSGLTMEGVATCAGTGKAALYRRWSGKEDLVVEALNHVLPLVDSAPDSGDLRTDLAATLDMMRTSVNSRAGRAILAIMGELDRDHDFIKTIKERVLAPRKSCIMTVLQRAADRGDISPERVTPIVAETAPALVMMCVIGEGPPVSAEQINQILDDVMMPLLHSGSPKRATTATA